MSVIVVQKVIAANPYHSRYAIVDCDKRGNFHKKQRNNSDTDIDISLRVNSADNKRFDDPTYYTA